MLISSSRSDEFSWVLPRSRNSAFGGALLRALGGDAAREGDVFVRVFDVFQFVTEEVTTLTNGNQYPVLKAFDLDSNYPIALVPSRTTQTVSEAEEFKQSALALIIGVSRCAGLRRLPTSAADASDLHGLLTDASRGSYLSERVIHMLDSNATRSSVSWAFDRLIQLADASSTVLLYYSGYGFVRGSETYLSLHDTRLDDLESTALSGTELVRLLEAIETKRLVFILDATHTAGVGTPK